MNEFIAKKLAEVQAFINLGASILDRSGENFNAAAPIIAQDLHFHKPDISGLVSASELAEVFTAKVQKTTAKVTQMMELYIGNDWDDPVEVLEWLSFYSGAAAAHAALVASALKTLGMTSEQQELADISDAFSRLLEDTKTMLAQSGAERVTNA
jgi:hypothetical protein